MAAAELTRCRPPDPAAEGMVAPVRSALAFAILTRSMGLSCDWSAKCMVLVRRSVLPASCACGTLSALPPRCFAAFAFLTFFCLFFFFLALGFALRSASAHSQKATNSSRSRCPFPSVSRWAKSFWICKMRIAEKTAVQSGVGCQRSEQCAETVALSNHLRYRNKVRKSALHNRAQLRELDGSAVIRVVAVEQGAQIGTTAHVRCGHLGK